MGKDGDKAAGWISTLEKGFALLESLEARDGARISELAHTHDMAKSNVHNYLSTLRGLGYVKKRGSAYTLSVKFLPLGGYARANDPRFGKLYRLAKPEVERVAQELGEVVRVMAGFQTEGMILLTGRASDALERKMYPGTRVPMHVTALGKVYLAHSPQEQIERYLEQADLPEYTYNSLTDPEEFRRDMDLIRSKPRDDVEIDNKSRQIRRDLTADTEWDMAFNIGERVFGVRSVAVTLESETEVLGAISISGPTRRMRVDDQGELRPEVLNAVWEIKRVIELKWSNQAAFTD